VLNPLKNGFQRLLKITSLHSNFHNWIFPKFNIYFCSRLLHIYFAQYEYAYSPLSKDPITVERKI